MQQTLGKKTGAAFMQQDPRKEGYNKGWKERGEHDAEIIGDAFRNSRNYHDFMRILKEKFSEAEWTSLL
ncbi:MAG: hypothetical protein ACYCT2_04615 [Thermoplasmataceae archaeon]